MALVTATRHLLEMAGVRLKVRLSVSMVVALRQGMQIHLQFTIFGFDFLKLVLEI
jgi:hypothetical protein